MSTLIAGNDLLTLAVGRRADRATAVLPATAYGALFTVATGRILVTGLVGEFTVVASGTATTVKVTGTPTTGTATDWSTAVAVTSKEVGSMITLPAAFGGATVVNNAGAGGQLQVAAPFVAQIGTVGITTSATNTGSVRWSLFWIPLDNAATVVAA